MFQMDTNWAYLMKYCDVQSFSSYYPQDVASMKIE
jgi:hypothetical protein